MVSTVVVGSTGLVGSYILSSLLTLPTISSVHTVGRRQPKSTGAKLQAIVEPDNAQWTNKLSSIQPTPDIFFSGLGTTRAQAGSFENQRKIDYDLNLDLAKAAKAAGVKVYVLISSGGGSTSSQFPYMRMKAELEEAVKEVGFEHVVLLQPGLIIGAREDTRLAELTLQKVVGFLGVVSGGWLKDQWAQDAEVIGKAAIAAGLKALQDGKGSPKVWEVGQSEIIKLGRTEWKD